MLSKRAEVAFVLLAIIGVCVAAPTIIQAQEERAQTRSESANGASGASGDRCADLGGVRVGETSKCFFIRRPPFGPLVTELNWADAEAECRSLGGHLASIMSEAENDLVHGLFHTMPSGISSMWIGMNDRWTEGQWLWSDGNPVVYDKWDVNEPNDYHGQDCGVMWKLPTNDLWDDQDCSWEKPFVCAVHTHPTCDSLGGIFKDRKCFFVPPNSPSRQWAGAESTCKEFGGHLASITSEHESDIVKGLFVRSGAQGSHGAMWIGLNDQASENEWVWSDGSYYSVLGFGSYRSWTPGEPNNYLGWEDCVEVWRNGMEWNDNTCNSYRPFVCAVRTDDECDRVGRSDSARLFRADDNTCWIIPKYLVPTDGRASWSHSRDLCSDSSVGGRIASITSDAENGIAYNLFEISGVKASSEPAVWIGMTDQTTEGVWEWSDGSVVRYENWAPGQPNGGSWKDQDCAMIYGTATGWGDAPCDSLAPTLCKVHVGSQCDPGYNVRERDRLSCVRGNGKTTCDSDEECNRKLCSDGQTFCDGGVCPPGAGDCHVVLAGMEGTCTTTLSDDDGYTVHTPWDWVEIKVTSTPAAASSFSCPQHWEMLEGDVAGCGRIDGFGGGFGVNSCDDCATACNSRESCRSFECSPTTLQCSLNEQREPTSPAVGDFVLCAKPQFFDTTLECPEGYTQREGDIPGWGTVENAGGGHLVAGCHVCVGHCEAREGCQSFECSPTENRCNLNFEREPSAPAHGDYAFCAKDGARSDGCVHGFFEMAGSIPGEGSVNGFGGPTEYVRHCKECGGLCLADQDCLSYECSDEELICHLNAKQAPSESAPAVTEFNDVRRFCARNACAEGYSERAGDIPGSGRVGGDLGRQRPNAGGNGGGFSVANCVECAEACNSYSTGGAYPLEDYWNTCRSYECSDTELQCNLNIWREPTVGPGYTGLPNQRFCAKDNVDDVGGAPGPGCAAGYTANQGHIPGAGDIGLPFQAEHCGDCATRCDQNAECNAYECSPGLVCSLYTQSQPTDTAPSTQLFCTKADG